MSELERTLFEIVALLDRLGYRYAVMGGLAVRVHSIPRPTHDIDLTIAISRDELKTLFQQLEQQGHTIPESYLNGWVDEVGGMPLVKVRTYLTPTVGVDIDVFLSETDFQESCLARRQQVMVNDQNLWVVSPEDLILLKLLADRPRDRIDVADILFIQGELDQSYLRNWAEQLQVSDRLESALATNHTNGHE